jgi:hypothetical protein
MMSPLDRLELLPLGNCDVAMPDVAPYDELIATINDPGSFPSGLIKIKLILAFCVQLDLWRCISAVSTIMLFWLLAAF